MIEEQLAEMYRTAVTDLPEPRFSPDDIVVEARRRQRARRAVAASVTATVAVATGVLVLSAGDPVPETSPAATTTTQPAPTTVAELCEIVPTMLAERGGGPKIVSPGTYTRVGSEKQHGGGCGYELAGLSNQQIVVFAYSDGVDPNAAWGQLVSDTPQRDGSHLRVYRLDEQNARGIAITHVRADGVLAGAQLTELPEPGQHELAYTQDQLTAIATDPRLVVTST